jgi:transketolase
MVYEAMTACDILEKEGVKPRLINMHTIKPIDRDVIVKAAEETGAIVTAEEHTVLGGLGSAVAEVIVKSRTVPMRMIGVQDSFGVSGESDELFEYFGLKAKDIVTAAKAVLAAK